MSDQQDTDPLPYTQVDRAVKAKAALLAGRLGVTLQHALGSLVEFWDLNGDPRALEKLWSEGKDEVVLAPAEVRVRFLLASGREADPAELAALGLLEPRGDLYRVRGISRFFAPIKARMLKREAGKKGGEASVLARKTQNGTAQPVAPCFEPASESAQAPVEALPKQPRSTPEADAEAAPKQRRTQRSAVSGQRATPSETQGRRAALSDALVNLYRDVRKEPYRFIKATDPTALTVLLAFDDDPLVLAKWERGLRLGAKWPGISTITELAGNKWNHLSAADPPGKGPIDSATQSHTQTGWVDQF